MISTVFAAIKQRLEVNLRAAGEEIPRHELGAWKLPQTSAPNQIVWVVLGGQVSGARQGQARLGIQEIAVRDERIDVHVWGKGGLDETERLMNHFVAACRELGTAYSFKALSTLWTVGQDQVTTTGRLCILTIQLSIPFTAEPIAISQPPHTVTIDATVTHS